MKGGHIGETLGGTMRASIGRVLVCTAAASALFTACGTDSSSTESTAADPGTGLSETTVIDDSSAAVVTDQRGVAVRVLGVLTADGTLCPAGSSMCESGIRFEGGTGGAAAGDTVTGLGWYDGARLLLSVPLQPGDSPLPQDLNSDSLCPGMTNPGPVDRELLDRAFEMVGSTPPAGGYGSDSVALVWGNPATNVITFWFARDLDLYRDRLLGIFGQFQVCVVDGARFSERELRIAANHVLELAEQGLFSIQNDFGVENRENRVIVPIEVLDPAGRAALGQLPRSGRRRSSSFSTSRCRPCRRASRRSKERWI
jgi:hypothetical protein